jgi:hypothetical protein
MVAALGVAVVLGTVVACGHQESATPQLSETSHPTPAPNAAPSVELLEPGAEPRETLRFRLTEGAQFRATMTTQMAIGIEIDGEQMPASTVPPMLADMTTTVHQVAPDGDVDYTFTMENFRVGDGTILSPEAQRSFDQLSGVTGQAAMTATGEHTNIDLDIPPDLDPQMRSSLEGISSQLAKVTVRFPTEPVGIGARWRTRSSAELNGLRTDVTSTYTLRERNGDRYLTGVSYEQSAPDQDAALPGLPPGVRAHVDGMAISGSGEMEGSLSMVFPLTSTMHGSGTMDMRVDDGQNSEEMRQNLDMTVSVESVP